MERLSGLDATFLYLETPNHHMHVAMTMVLDPSTMPGGYSFEKLKTFIRSRLHVVPLFHRRLAEVPFRLNHPVWVEDPDFDLDYHLRRIDAPAPGGRRELAEIAGQIASIQLDRSKPLWEMWVVEGLKQDRVGVVTKVHHCAIDGASGADFLVHLFDLEPVASEDFGEPQELPTEHLPSDFELLGFAAASLARQTANMIPLVGRTAQSIARVVQGRRDPDRMVGAVPLSAPQTPWTASVTGHRSTAFARVSLTELKKVKNTFGSTLNDAVLALVAGTLREYLDEIGEQPSESLLAICPISVHGDDVSPTTQSANRVSGMFVSLGTDIEDIGDRLAHIRMSTKGAKEEHNAVGASMLMDWAEYASPNVFNMASRLYSSMSLANRHRAIHNVIVSNVPGPNFPLYYAGAELVAAYPLGPVMEGCGLNITVFSYRDSIDIGFMACRELIPDVWALAEATDRAMWDLSEATATEVTKQQRARGIQTQISEPQPTSPAQTSTPASAKPEVVTAKPASGKPAGTVPPRTSSSERETEASARQTAVKKESVPKTAASKKAPAKKAPAKKTAAKKAPAARKSPARKASARKAPVARTSPAKKAPATKKPTAKKASAKTTAAKKAPATKSSPARKAAAKRAPATKKASGSTASR